MVRNPAYAATFGWLGAFAGFFAANLVTGSDLPTTIWFTAANIAGAATAICCSGSCLKKTAACAVRFR